jgi:hypothetical protein
MSGWKFRHVFWVTSVIRIVASFFDIILVKRWNVTWHIPDKVMYLFGDAIVYNICYMLEFMPAVVMTGKLCPKNMESTVYALLAGFQNFGQQAAKTLGVFLMKQFGIQSNESDPKQCNFEHLDTLIIIGHMLLPLLAVRQARRLCFGWARPWSRFGTTGGADVCARPRRSHDGGSARGRSVERIK